MRENKNSVSYLSVCLSLEEEYHFILNCNFYSKLGKFFKSKIYYWKTPSFLYFFISKTPAIVENLFNKDHWYSLIWNANFFRLHLFICFPYTCNMTYCLFEIENLKVSVSLFLSPGLYDIRAHAYIKHADIDYQLNQYTYHLSTIIYDRIKWLWNRRINGSNWAETFTKR